MPDFMVLKQTDTQGLASDWTPITIARNVDGEEEAIKQGYSGEGTYKALPWDEDVEAAVNSGEPEVTMVSKRAVAEAAQAESGKAS
jgi:hypothetical protein